MSIKRIRTICTIGPASESKEILEKLIVMGMDVARINFSHATHDQYLRIKDIIQSLSEKHQKQVEIMMDLQGPRMRVGNVPIEGIDLLEGKEVIFSTDPLNLSAIHIDDPYLHLDILPNHPIFLANGDLELLVIDTNKQEIKAKVIRGGKLYSKKGVNVPETNLTTRGLTEKDKKDVAFGVAQNVDQIALSFVKDKKDIIELRSLLNGKDIKIISKIEIKQAIYNLDEIIHLSDLIMVARGDLGIELPLEELPIVQKDIIKRTNIVHKPSIVATQMLMSMVSHYRPTRAEVSDVANAVFDGAEYLMLSDETAFGEYPTEAFSYLVRTIEKAQQHLEKTAP